MFLLFLKTHLEGRHVSKSSKQDTLSLEPILGALQFSKPRYNLPITSQNDLSLSRKSHARQSNTTMSRSIVILTSNVILNLFT